jgi:hypothetical protein
MKAKGFLIVLCLFCVGVLPAQNSTFIQKWEQQARSRGASWNSYTRAATAANRPTYTSLFVNGKFVASFNNNSACQTKVKELVEIADNLYGKSTTSNSSSGNSKRSQALRDLGRRTGVDTDGLRNQLSKKFDEASAKSKQETLSKVRESCKCRTEKNPNYDPNHNANAKSYNFSNNDLFSTGDDDNANDTQSNPLFDGVQTQFDNPLDAPSARTLQAAQQGSQPNVSLNFDDVGQYAGGIYVGNVNWKSGGFAPVEGLERRASDYTLNKLDAIKNEIAVDLDFRNEVAGPIQAFLEGKGSLPQLLRDLYKERTGYDIEELRNKRNLTEEERKIAEDYNHFAKQMAIELDYQANEAKKKPNPEKNLIDFAIMANDVYKDSDFKGLEDTDWKPIDYSIGIKDNAIAQAIDAINEFNNDGTGFYAQIYKNGLTGEYTLAFRGTNMMSPADWYNNVMQGFSIQNRQYANAALIGELLKDSKEKINIVGHSLGGGLATVAGLQTGFPTYTYNQADISQGTVDTYHLDVSKSDNITAHYAEGEILTTLQNETREYNTLIPLGKKVKTGSAIKIEENKTLTVVAEIAKATPYPLVKAAGVVATKANLVAMGDAHRMSHTEQYFRATYSASQNKWARCNDVQSHLRNDNTYSKILIDTK